MFLYLNRSRAQLVAEIRITAVPGAASVESPVRMLVVKNAAMLVSPIPGKDLFTVQDSGQLVIHLTLLEIEPRDGLMVTEKNQFARAFLIDQVFQPRDLIVRQTCLVILQIGIVVSAIKSDQQPMI